MGILTVLIDNGAPVNSIVVVLEETINFEDLPVIPTAFASLFGLLKLFSTSSWNFLPVAHRVSELKNHTLTLSKSM